MTTARCGLAPAAVPSGIIVAATNATSMNRASLHEVPTSHVVPSRPAVGHTAGACRIEALNDVEAPAGASTSRESACKPDSVPRPGGRGGDHPSGACVAADLGATYPGLCRRAAGVPVWSCSGWGLPSRPVARDAGELLPHRFTLACSSCSRGSTTSSAVCSLLHFPSDRSAWPLASTLPCGVRTFLGARFPGPPRSPDGLAELQGSW